MFVNVKKMQVEFQEAIHFRIYPDEETVAGFLSQKYDLVKMYIPGNPIGEWYKTWRQATEEERQNRIQDEMKYGFSFALSRAELEFALAETRAFTPYFADGYNLIRIFGDAIEFLRLEESVYARAVLAMPWRKAMWSALKTGLGEPLPDPTDYEAEPYTITFDEEILARWKEKYAPRVEVRWNGSPNWPQNYIKMVLLPRLATREDFSEHLASLERWAEGFSDGNLVRLDFYPDPWETKFMSFSWGIYVYQDEEGQVEDRRFTRGEHKTHCPVCGGLIYHESSDRYSIHT